MLHPRLPGILTAALLGAASFCLIPSALSASDPKVFNVRDFGAVGDGQVFDTEALQKALNTCRGSGGTVLVPKGTYLCKPLVIGTSTTLRLEEGALLQASTNQADWMKIPGDWLHAKSGGDFKPFLSGQRLADVTICGSGVIDGGGSAWWEAAEEHRRKIPGATLPRPNLVVIKEGRNLRFDGITLRNSPKFHLVPTDCDGVTITNVTILAPERAANTDAIDPSNCRDVVITGCRIDTGDDNVAIKSGKKVPGREFGCENITVTGCAILHGHGVSIGSETVGGIRNVRVSNCTFSGTENALRIKSAPGRGGRIEDISYSDCTMTNVNPAIVISSRYGGSSAGDSRQAAAAESSGVADIPVIRNVTFSNVTATCPKLAGIIQGLPDSPISGVTMRNVRITSAKPFEISNATNVILVDSSVTPESGEGFLLGTNASVSGLPAGSANH
jgi:polygalacturonase